MISAKLSKRGQISIPKKIRDQFDLKPGDSIVFKVQAENIILQKISPSNSDKKLSDILLECEPLEEDSITFQRKLRDEWE
jgi:AbrB family looped-hinge helix DNA binding protein